MVRLLFELRVGYTLYCTAKKSMLLWPNNFQCQLPITDFIESRSVDVTHFSSFYGGLNHPLRSK
jgi:hypothetical protein